MDGITREDVDKLVDLTLKDMPKMPLSLLLSAVSGCKSDEEVVIMIVFMTKQYTVDEILAETQRQNKFLLKLFNKEKP
jgi:hypothetical protein